MLIMSFILIGLASILGGWVFMCDCLPIPPKLAWSPIPLLVAVLIALVGVVILFVIKWYLGLLGIILSIVGFNLFAALWDYIYRWFRL
jgi:hypothetical protein